MLKRLRETLSNESFDYQELNTVESVYLNKSDFDSEVLRSENVKKQSNQLRKRKIQR